VSLGRILAASLAAIGAGGAAALGYSLLRDQTTDDDATGESLMEPPVAQGEAKTLGARAVEELTYHLGEKGKGPKGSAGYHRGKLIDEVMRGRWNDAGDKLLGKPWCARAVRWAFEEAAADLGLPKPFSGLGTLATAESWKESPFKNYLLSSAKVGAVFVIKTPVGFHTGLVAKVLGPLSVVTIEGNHGDSVASVKRTFDLSKDALVDVEAWINRKSMQAVVGLNYFAVESCPCR
jgi:hypothetical protein